MSLIWERYNRWHHKQMRDQILRDANQDDLSYSPPQDARAKLDREREYKAKLKASGSDKTSHDKFAALDGASVLEFVKKYKL